MLLFCDVERFVVNQIGLDKARETDITWLMSPEEANKDYNDMGLVEISAFQFDEMSNKLTVEV